MKKLIYLLAVISMTCAGCLERLSTDSTLSGLTLSYGTTDQTFQSSQLLYSGTVGYLLQNIRITPTASNRGAAIKVNGVSVASGTQSSNIALSEGHNTITVEVTAEDGSNSRVYSVVLLRQYVAWFAQQAYLKASNAEAGDFFGYSVALSGDTLVVGAYGEDASATGGATNNTATEAGAVYVFTRRSGTWTQQAVLKASNAEAGDSFGYSVAISGDTIVVGAHLEDASATGGEGDNTALSAGAAYVFLRTAGVWSQQTYLKASNAEASDFFGFSVAISGDTIVVGAHLEDASATGGEGDNTALSAGAAYVFLRTAGVWSQQAYLKASNAEASDLFGYSVAISGDTLVVGAEGEDGDALGPPSNNLALSAGAAYVYVRAAGVWTQQARLKASNAEVIDLFGHSVSISGDTVAVGAYGEDANPSNGEGDNSTMNAGAVYIFLRSAGVWSQQAYLKASNGAANDFFGQSLSLSEDTLVVGAPGRLKFIIFEPQGGAYVFLRSAGSWSESSYLEASNAQWQDVYGYSVAVSGDSLAIGAHGEASSAQGGQTDNSAYQAGAVYVWR